MKILRVAHAVKHFKTDSADFCALNDVSFEVEQGEFLSIMGASGSGKSTLLHVIAGLTNVDSGHIWLDDEDVTMLSDAKLTLLRRRKIGFIFQSFNLIPTLNIEENILLPLLADHRKVDRAHFQKLTAFLGIDDKLKRFPNTLSGGEQQRAAIARALLINPALILADEPTGSLDSVAGTALCTLLKQYCRDEKCTLVMVTHEPHVAHFSDRIRVLRDGALLHEFKTADFAAPHDLAVAYNQLLEHVPAEV